MHGGGAGADGGGKGLTFIEGEFFFKAGDARAGADPAGFETAHGLVNLGLFDTGRAENYEVGRHRGQRSEIRSRDQRQKARRILDHGAEHSADFSTQQRKFTVLVGCDVKTVLAESKEESVSLFSPSQSVSLLMK